MTAGEQPLFGPDCGCRTTHVRGSTSSQRPNDRSGWRNDDEAAPQFLVPVVPDPVAASTRSLRARAARTGTAPDCRVSSARPCHHAQVRDPCRQLVMRIPGDAVIDVWLVSLTA